MLIYRPGFPIVALFASDCPFFQHKQDVFDMGNIYDNNLKSTHGPNGLEQRHQGPYGGKEADNLSNKAAGKVLPQTRDIKARPKQ